METKEEFSTEINKILGTTIDFTKLSKEELTSLHGALTKAKEDSDISLLDTPLGDLFDKKVFNRATTLRELLGLPKGRKGILGFGIIGKVLKEVEKNARSGSS